MKNNLDQKFKDSTTLKLESPISRKYTKHIGINFVSNYSMMHPNNTILIGIFRTIKNNLEEINEK